MTDKDIVERLRRRGNRYDDGAMLHGELVNPDGPEAADLIEALRTQLAEAVAALRKYGRHNGVCALVGGYGYCDCGLEAALVKLEVK